MKKKIEWAEDLTPLSDLQLEKRPYLIRNLIVSGAVNFISAPPSSNKSWLLLNFAKSIVDGQAFCGRKVEQREVFYFGREGTASPFIERCKKLGLYGHENFHPWGWFDPKGAPPFILDELYFRWAKKYRGSVFIFEPFGSFIKNEDMNTHEMRPITNRLTEIAITGGITVIVALHATMRESPKKFLGYTGIAAEAEVAYFARTQGANSAPTRRVTLELFKARAEVSGKMPMIWIRETGQFAALVDSAVERERLLRALLKTKIDQHGPISRRVLLAAGVSKGYADNVIRRILKSGIAKYWSCQRGKGKELLYCARNED
jgi:AAA domain